MQEKVRFTRKARVGMISAPLIFLLLWLLPLHIDAPAKHALAVVGLLVVLWITEVVDHGVTAFLGCYLFWFLGIVDFGTAFFRVLSGHAMVSLRGSADCPNSFQNRPGTAHRLQPDAGAGHFLFTLAACNDPGEFPAEFLHSFRVGPDSHFGSDPDRIGGGL